MDPPFTFGSQSSPPLPMRCSVVIVEDDEIFAEQLALAITQTADLRLVATARTIADGTQALERWTPDLLLTDLGLPDGNGLELIRLARTQRLAKDVLVLSVFGESRLVLQCLKAGATGYLLKGDGVDDVGMQIGHLRRGGRPISPMIARGVLDHFVSCTNETETPAVTLSSQERTVLQLCEKGCTYDEIARLLKLSRNTVETYVKRVFRKLQVGNKAEAVFEARRRGVDLD